jgi:hypothetical protein
LTKFLESDERRQARDYNASIKENYSEWMKSFTPPVSTALKGKDVSNQKVKELLELKDKERNRKKESFQYNNDHTAFRRFVGYDNGGDLQQLNSQSYDINADPNKVDPMQLNYKGKDIRVGDNEILDSGKDRVISENFFNPFTGKKIVDEYRGIEKSIGKAEKQISKGDPAALNTIKYSNLRKDDLFNLQESVKNYSTPQNQNNQALEGQAGYATGGVINPLMEIASNVYRGNQNPMNFTGQAQLDWLKQNGYSSMADYQYMTGSGQGMGPESRGVVGKLPSRLSLQDAANTVGLPSNYAAQRLEAMNGANAYRNLSPAQQAAMAGGINRDKKEGLAGLLGFGIEGLNAKGSSAKGRSWLDNFTAGEKVGLGASSLDLLLKGVEAMRPIAKEKYRYNTAPISMAQMNPAEALRTNNQSYLAALNYGNNSNSSAQRMNAMQGALSSKLAADNSVLSSYGNQNAQLRGNYEDRLGQRQNQDIAMSMQVDDLNQRNKDNAYTRRNNVYSSIGAVGQNYAGVMNNRLTNQAALDQFKLLGPDVWNNYIKNQKALQSTYSQK